MKKVVMSVSRWTVLLKISKARNYVQNITGNSFFSSPIPTLAEVTEAANAVEVAEQVYQSNGGKKDKADLDTKEIVLDNRLRRLGLYVSLVADGNQAVILPVTEYGHGWPAALRFEGNSRCQQLRGANERHA